MMVLSIFWLRILNILSQARLYPVRLIIHGKKPLSPLSHSLLPLRIKRRLGKDENSPGYLLTFSTSIFREEPRNLISHHNQLFRDSQTQKLNHLKFLKSLKKSNLNVAGTCQCRKLRHLESFISISKSKSFIGIPGRLSPSGQRLALKTTVMYACCCINCQFHG